MNFSSLLFIFFFAPVALAAYHLIPERARNPYLLAASLFFYAWGTPTGAAVLVGASLVDYILGAMIARRDGAARKALLVLGVVFNIAALAYFKYSNFFVAELSALLGAFGMSPIPWERVVFPVGISFFTFHKISYLVDVYTGKARPAGSALDYLTYTCMFPKLMQGPIVRWNTIREQMHGRRAGLEEAYDGLTRFLYGLGKKVLIADTIAKTADAAFGLGPSALSVQDAWLGAIAYAMQIYFDFSGYTDMAIGLALMMGFRLPENFNRPYMAINFTDFWRRWHITLSGFLREYLYIPLGGNRVGKLRLYVNLWTVFLISGLWHGADFTFIIWGAYHGFFLVMDRVFWAKFSERLGHTTNVVLTFVLVVFGWVLFRSPDMGFAIGYVGRMLGFGTATPDDMAHLINNRGALVLALAVVLSFFPEGALASIAGKVRGASNERARAYGMMACLVAVFLLSLGYIFNNDFRPYIYFTF